MSNICNKIPSVDNLYVKIEIEFHYWPIFLQYRMVKKPKGKIHFLFPPLNIWCSIKKYFLPGKALRNWIIFSFSCQFSFPFKIVKMLYQQFMSGDGKKCLVNIRVTIFFINSSILWWMPPKSNILKLVKCCGYLKLL